MIPSMPGMHSGEAKDLVVHVAGGELPRQGGITLLPGKKYIRTRILRRFRLVIIDKNLFCMVNY